MRTKVAVHKIQIGSSTAIFKIVVGVNPFGLRGGASGNWVDGKEIAPLFHKRADAESAARAIQEAMEITIKIEQESQLSPQAPFIPLLSGGKECWF